MKSIVKQINKLSVGEVIVIPWDDPALEGQRPQGPGEFGTLEPKGPYGVIVGRSFAAEPTDAGLKVKRTK